jgi:quinol monooxygenase YgiN
MIVEYIRYSIDEGRREAFESDYALAATSLSASEHCLGYDLAVCVEQPTEYVLRIEWDSAEGHLRGFRKSPGFRDFFARVKPYVTAIQEMRHYRPTSVQYARVDPTTPPV